MTKHTITEINSISEFHKLRELPSPEHPLISVIDYRAIVHKPDYDNVSWLQKYYSIALKKDVPGKYRYGQQDYDFDDGLMSFFAPNQILNIEYVENDTTKKPSGWILLIHPDFLWNTPLATKIKEYDFFNYSVTESLFLSDKEEKIDWCARLLRQHSRFRSGYASFCIFRRSIFSFGTGASQMISTHSRMTLARQ